VRRIGNLAAQLATRENVLTAVWKGTRGRTTQPAVVALLARLDDTVDELQSGLVTGKLRLGPYSVFEVRDTKRREIHAPGLRDRILHHALMNVLGPVLEQGAMPHSYACREGRGQHRALHQARHWTRRTDWYVKVDVRRYFDTLDHHLLRMRLAGRFRERRVLALFDQVLDSYAVVPGKGLPIGALTSQYLANFFLDGVDSRLLATGLCQRYLRYMDDLVIWQRRENAREVHECVLEALATLQLGAKHGGESNRCRRGVPMLGFVVYPDRIRLNRMARRRFRSRYGFLCKALAAGRAGEHEFLSRAQALVAHASIGDDSAWLKAVLALRPPPVGWD